MNGVYGDKRSVVIFVLPALLIFTLIVLLPIIMTGYYSLLDWNGLGAKEFVGLDNYKDMFFTDKWFLKSLGNSFIFAGMSIFIQLPIALVLALILARGIKGESFFRNVYFVPVVISTIVIGKLWMQIYHADYGLLNTFLRAIGLDSLAHEWLSDTKTALWAAFVPQLWQYIGYHMLLMYTFAKSIPEEIYESAKIDGASPVNIAFRITIPLMKPIIRTCVIFALIGSLRVFDLIYVLTLGGPLHATEVPSTLMYTATFREYRYGYGSAIAFFVIAECLILTVAIQKIFKSKDEGIA